MSYTRNNTVLDPDAQIEIDGTIYPPGVLRHYSDAELATLGIERTPDPVPPAAAPEVLYCNAAQIRLALNAQGLRQQVEDAVTVADQDTRDLWQYSPVFREDDPNIAALALAIGKNSADVHDLFVLARTL